MDVSVNAPQKQGRTISEWVWFEGATALKEGQGVCYNFDYGTATEKDGRRSNRVELPSAANARYFAGVAARDYAAKTGGQLIEIYCPGSYCNILAKVNATLGAGIVTCEAGGTYAGYFRYEGFQGEGSAVPLQTVDRSTTAGKVFALLQTGEPSGLVEVKTMTAAGGALGAMVGGVTYVDGVALTGAHITQTLANGTLPGLKKKFEVIADLGDTYDFVLTVTSGVQRACTATTAAILALASDTMDDVNDVIVLEWFEGAWQELYAAGGTLSAT